MKNFKFILFITLFILFSCSDKPDQRYVIKEIIIPNRYFEYSGGAWSSMTYRIEERDIDNCEYIIIFGADSRNIIHKANCKNTEHKCN